MDVGVLEEIYAGEDPLCGRVTSQEAQWAVVVTMGAPASFERDLFDRKSEGLEPKEWCHSCFSMLFWAFS